DGPPGSRSRENRKHLSEFGDDQRTWSARLQRGYHQVRAHLRGQDLHASRRCRERAEQAPVGQPQHGHQRYYFRAHHYRDRKPYGHTERTNRLLTYSRLHSVGHREGCLQVNFYSSLLCGSVVVKLLWSKKSRPTIVISESATFRWKGWYTVVPWHP